MSMTMRITAAATLLAGLCSLSGCGGYDSRVQQAQVALDAGRYELALELADKALGHQPGDPLAMRIKARAMMGQGRLPAAGNVLRQAVTLHPDNADNRAELASWCAAELTHLLTQSNLLSDAALRERFESSRKLGVEQSDWLLRHGSETAGRLTAARLLEAAVSHARLELHAARADPRLHSPDAFLRREAAEAVEARSQRVEALLDEACDHLDRLLRSEPDHEQACLMYSALLSQRGQWRTLTKLVERVIAGPPILPNVAERLVTGLLMMPESELTSARRQELGWAVLHHVPLEQRGELTWTTTVVRLHQSAGQWDQASAAIEAARKDRPEDPFLSFLEAQNDYGRGDLNAARATLEKLVMAGYTSQPSRVLLGLTLMRLGRSDLAVNLLREAAELNPDDPTARLALLTNQTEGGFVTEALSSAEQYLRENPSSPTAIRMVLQLYGSRGMREPAQRVLREVEQLDPLTDEHLRILVDHLPALGRPDAALNYAQTLAGRRPDTLADQLRLASAYLANGEDQRAAEVIAKQREVFSQDPRFESSVAAVYLHAPRLGSTLPMLEKAVEDRPEDLEARLRLAQAYAVLERFTDAAAMIESVLDRQPGSLDAHALAWRIAQTLGQQERAQERLGLIDPARIDALLHPALAAHLALDEGDARKAIAIANRAVVAGHNDPLLHILMAQAYERLGDVPMVETNLRALVAKSPDNTPAWLMLLRFYLQWRNIDRGLSQFTDLAELNPSLAAICKAQLLISALQHESAATTLTPVFNQLLAARDSRTMLAADTLAQAALAGRDVPRAQAVYQKLIDADFQAPQAMLRAIDLGHNPRNPLATAAALSTLADRLPPTEMELRLEVVRRFAALNEPQAALDLLDRWSAQDGETAALATLRGEVLMSAGRGDEAVAAQRRAVELEPGVVEHLLKLGWLHQGRGDAPSAEAAFERAKTLGPRAHVAALGQLMTHYARQGLLRPTVRTFDELLSLQPTPAPELLLLAGRSRVLLGDAAGAVELLQRVPRRSPSYAPAQVEIARVDLAGQRNEAARERLLRLVNDSDTAAAAATTLLEPGRADPLAQTMTRWCEGYLDAHHLPEALEVRWQQNRLALARTADDLNPMLSALERLAMLRLRSAQPVAARIALLLARERIEDAGIAYDSSNQFRATPKGRLLALVLARPPVTPVSADASALDRLLEALLTRDLDAARAAAELIEVRRTIFRTDLLEMLQRSDLTAQVNAWHWRWLTVAAVALESGLPQLAQEIALKAIGTHGSLNTVLAHALHAHALLAQGLSTGPALELARRDHGSSVLRDYLEFLSAVERGDIAGQIRHGQRVVERESNHVYTIAALGSALRQGGQIEQALTHLRRLAENENPLRTAACVELAELLAEQDGDALSRAAELIGQAITRSDAGAEARATLGWIEHRQGRHEQAARELALAVAELPDRLVVHYRLGLVYQSLGQQRWARLHLEQAAAGPKDQQVVRDAQIALDRPPAR